MINVRGALGTQVIELLAALARLAENGEKIENRSSGWRPSSYGLSRETSSAIPQAPAWFININAGGDVVDTVREDYLSQLICNVSCTVDLNGTKKTGGWNVEDFRLIKKHNAAICDALVFRNMNNSVYLKELIHVRGKDRQLISTNTYIKMYDKLRLPVIGDDPHIIDIMTYEDNYIGHVHRRMGIDYTAAQDWMTVLNADVVHCSISSFVISALLLDPMKEAHIIRPTEGAPHKVSSHVVDAVEFLAQEWPNVTFDEFK